MNPFINPAEGFLKRTELNRAKIDLAVKSAGPKTVSPTPRAHGQQASFAAEMAAQAQASGQAAAASAAAGQVTGQDPVTQAQAVVAALEAEQKKNAPDADGKPPVDNSIHYAEPSPDDDEAKKAKLRARLMRKKLGLDSDETAAEEDAQPDPGVKAGRSVDVSVASGPSARG